MMAPGKDLWVVFAALSVVARADLECPAETRACCPVDSAQGTPLTTATFEVPWAEALVRSRETSIGNLVTFAEYEFFIARFSMYHAEYLAQRVPLPAQPLAGSCFVIRSPSLFGYQLRNK